MLRKLVAYLHVSSSQHPTLHCSGAITSAGGRNLAKDRLALPLLKGEGQRRCRTGSAVVTGPGEYGKLQVPYVIHAVGPNYMMFPGNFETPDELLRSAYQSSLDACVSHGITDLAFALLSAGIYRGQRDSRDVLQIGISSIRDWVDDQEEDSCGELDSVTLCGYSQKETDLLLDICEQELPNARDTPNEL